MSNLIRRLRFDKLKYNLKTFRVTSALKFWIQDIKYAHQRCDWCGWYLYPNILFKNVNPPTKMVHWSIDNQWVCANCKYTLDKINEKRAKAL